MSRGPIGWIGALWRFVVDVALRWYHGRVGDLAASVTFWIVISMPALVLALLAVLGPLDRMITGVGFSSRIETEVQEFISRVFTGEADAVSETVSGLFTQPNNSLAIVSAGLVLWSISRGFAGLIRALEDIYDIEDRRPWYWTRVVAIILGIGSLLISVPLVLMEIYVWAGIEDGVVESVLRSVVAVAVLVLWASIVYHYGPAERHRWRFDLPGAIVAAIGWWLLSFGFARYVDLTSNANDVRVAVGASLLVLTWIWLAAQVLLVGGAVNYLLGERLGVTRGRRTWSINEVVTKGTGEIKKIVVPDREETAERQAEPAPTANGRPVPSRPVEPIARAGGVAGGANGQANGVGRPVPGAEPVAGHGEQPTRPDPLR